MFLSSPISSPIQPWFPLSCGLLSASSPNTHRHSLCPSLPIALPRPTGWIQYQRRWCWWLAGKLDLIDPGPAASCLLWSPRVGSDGLIMSSCCFSIIFINVWSLSSTLEFFSMSTCLGSGRNCSLTVPCSSTVLKSWNLPNFHHQHFVLRFHLRWLVQFLIDPGPAASLKAWSLFRSMVWSSVAVVSEVALSTNVWSVTFFNLGVLLNVFLVGIRPKLFFYCSLFFNSLGIFQTFLTNIFILDYICDG